MGDEMSTIRILLVDDSAATREIIRRIVEEDPELKVVGMASDGQEAIERAAELSPDMILMDVEMPRMDGISSIKAIMSRFPTPIMVVSSARVSQECNLPFEAIRAGALDLFLKPVRGRPEDYEAVGLELRRQIRLLSRIRVISRPAPQLPRETIPLEGQLGGLKLVVIGTSTGGPQALLEVLGRLPAVFPLPVLVVQHMSKDFLPSLVEWLANQVKIPLKVAAEGDRLRPGMVYFAPGDVHMRVTSQQTIKLDQSPPIHSCRPSVDALFFSVVEQFGGKEVGIILTGMGADGAQGLKRIRDHGGRTIVQDEKSSIIYGMPLEAIKCGGAEKILPVEQIADEIIHLVMGKRGEDRNE